MRTKSDCKNKWTNSREKKWSLTQPTWWSQCGLTTWSQRNFKKLAQAPFIWKLKTHKAIKEITKPNGECRSFLFGLEKRREGLRPLCSTWGLQESYFIAREVRQTHFRLQSYKLRGQVSKIIEWSKFGGCWGVMGSREEGQNDLSCSSYCLSDLLPARRFPK